MRLQVLDLHQAVFLMLTAYLTGFHATSPESFANAIHDALSLSPTAQLAMRERAKKWAVERFSEDEFRKSWDASGWKKFIPAI